MSRACYPGSFDPLTVAHVALARAAVDQVDVVDGVDFVLSRSALGKSHASSTLAARCAAIESCGFRAVVTDAQLLADVADGYEVLVMGADKWVQLLDVDFYGGSAAARDAAVARLPRVLAVAPRPGHDVPAGMGSGGVERVVIELEVEPWLAEVSSTAVRDGATQWLAMPSEATPGRTRQSPE